MKKISVLFLLAIALILQASSANAGYLKFYDTVNEWDGIHTYYHNYDVIGTPQITGGSFVFNAHKLVGIDLNYESTACDIMPADWFFDVDQDNHWDYVFHNTISLDWKTGLKSNYSLYKVDMPINDWNNYYKATFGERYGHPTQARDWYLRKYGTLIDEYVDFSQWNKNPYAVSKDKPATAIWSGFEIDMNKYAGQHMTYAFAMTCANDVLYNQIPLPSPEPGTFILLGIGALGLFLFERKRHSAAY